MTFQSCSTKTLLDSCRSLFCVLLNRACKNGSVSMVEIPFNGEMINRLLLKFHKGNLGALE